MSLDTGDDYKRLMRQTIPRMYGITDTCPQPESSNRGTEVPLLSASLYF